MHLPYFLITATMLLFGIEKVFLTLRKGNVTQNKFFALLVDYEILRSSEGKAGSEVLVFIFIFFTFWFLFCFNFYFFLF